MRLHELLFALLAAAAMLPISADASDTSYIELAGSPAGVYRNALHNFQLDLESMPYKVVDLSEQVPEASFAAMRFDPLVFTMAIAEDLGVEMTVEQYVDIVATATAANFDSGKLETAVERIGKTTVDGAEAIQLGFSGSIDGTSASYVITAFVNGTTAYQLTSFAGGKENESVREEADAIARAFSFLGDALATTAPAKPVDRYRSDAFGYALAADDAVWFSWGGLPEDYPYADTGALGSRGYGAAIMPYCWAGNRPTQLAMLDVMMERFGEDYPSPFITTEEPIARGNMTGVHLHGEDRVDDGLYSYHFWIVASDECAYAVAAWGPAGSEDAEKDLVAFWNDVSFTGPATIRAGNATETEKRNNAFFLNQTGMHYYEARSNREAFRFISQATDLDTAEASYLMNGLRVLSELDAYEEANDWLQERIDRYADDQLVKSWDAWLAHQVGDADKAVALYDELFGEGYREDSEFRVYLELLAGREQWDRIDTEFEAYAGENVTDELRRLKASLLSARGRYDEALALLDGMSKGRPFSAELAYSKIEVYDAMEDASGILGQAESLIDNNYPSLDSWFYKGYAQYMQRSYIEARESFEYAQKFAPTNILVQEYINAINGILGEGDNASISEAIAAARLPPDVLKRVEKLALAATRDGYGAYFVNRIVGYDFDGGETVTQSYYQRIKVQDATGIESFSTLEFEFDPAFEQLYVNSLVVRNSKGDVLAEADRDAFYVTDTKDGFEASTEKTAHLPVPSLAPGAIIDVVVSKRIAVERGELPLDTHFLSSRRPINYSALFVTGDTSRYRYESFAVGKPRKSGNVQVWQLENPVIYRWEPMQPYFDRFLPWVTVGTTRADWEAAGRDYFAKIEDKLDHERIADTAKRLVRDVDDESRKIELISRYVQKELHYEAIEFGRRGYIPKTARETLRDRYGDCKDHAVLLYAMLNSVGVPAELALVNINQKVLQGLPNIDQFDHMIVSVPRAGGRVFIDTTDKDFSLGALPPRYMAGNSALVIGNTPALVDIPDFEPGDSSLRVARDVERVGKSEIRVREIGTFAGYQAAELRGQLREIESSEMLTTMQRWVADRYTDAVVVDAFVDNLLAADSELIVELEYRLPLDDGEGFKVPGFFEAEYLDTARLADRRFVFELPAPFNVSAVTTIRQSATAKLAVASNKPDEDESRFGHWKRHIDKSDDSWVLRLEYTGRKSQFPANDYSDYAEFHRRLIGSIEQPVIMQ